MKMEIYRGIEFFRISAMPEEQQALIRQTLDRTKVIKILREGELLNDCVLATDYHEWASASVNVEQRMPETRVAMKALRLAFK
jgi:hypothetical protein